jgi:hypothetical protein
MLSKKSEYEIKHGNISIMSPNAWEPYLGRTSEPEAPGRQKHDWLFTPPSPEPNSAWHITDIQ